MVKKLLKKIGKKAGKAAAVVGAGALAFKKIKQNKTKKTPIKSTGLGGTPTDKFFAKKGFTLKTGDARGAEAVARSDREKKDFLKKQERVAKAGGVSKLKMGGAVKSGTQQLTGFGKARRR